MCGSHRKRPAAEDADDDDNAGLISSLPPSAGKASDLLKDRSDAVKAIVVFVGAAKTAAENQFVNVRAKLQKLAKGKKGDPKATAVAQPNTDAKATPTPALQTVSSPPANAFTQQTGQSQRALRALPAATDVNNPTALSYAPAAKTEPAPLTAVPDAKPAPATKPKPVVATAPTTKAKTKPETKAIAAAKPAVANKKVAAKPASDSRQSNAPKQP
jgi:hypothetical protein